MQKHKAGKPGVCKHDGRGPAVYRLDYKESVSRKHERDCRNMVFAGTDMIDGNIVCAETNTITGKLYCDKKRRFEEGSASILEYTIVLPLCMLVVSAMIFLGCIFAAMRSLILRRTEPSHHTQNVCRRKLSGNSRSRAWRRRCGPSGDQGTQGTVRALRLRTVQIPGGAYNRSMPCAALKEVAHHPRKRRLSGMVPDLSGTDISIVEKTGLFGKEAVITVRQEIMLPGILEETGGKTACRDAGDICGATLLPPGDDTQYRLRP